MRYDITAMFMNQYCQTPVLGLGLGVDFIFALDNTNNNNNNNKNPHPHILKRTIQGDNEQGVRVIG